MRIASWLLLSIAAFPVAYQIRYSLAIIEARQTFLYIPFLVKPFTNRIESVGWTSGTGTSEEDRLRPGDELLAVNGRPFVGASVLSRELRASRRYVDAANSLPDDRRFDALDGWSFLVTVRSGGQVRTIPLNFANCTCGSLGTPWIYFFSVIPPVVCIAAGLIALLTKRRDPKAWAFFALMLALSQIEFVPESLASFSQTADPMEWQGWFRIPSVAYQAFFAASWPAWLLLFASFVSPPLTNRITKWAVAALVGASAGEALLVLGWSESYRTVASLHAAALGRTILALWPSSFFGIVMYPHLNPSGRAPLLLPPEVIGAALVVVMLLVAVAACWQRQRTIEFIGISLLTIPFLYRAASTVLAVWWVPYVPSLTLGALYLGMITSGWVLARKTWPPRSGIGAARLGK